ncbi:hypothetical protein A7A08_00565 [Methyloligella halotolerans]|uniref:CRISPR-associated protein n=1 Tax=Methyloligella halotolerans TaxID=1177755 RepID=A0A1E2S2J3_9HYPH|nr:hypothetical protein [Methyloligella halotolerans]ODA68733.1 hypothetical protein A7A08_00565 [Methyloligella halotolerans]
MDREEEPTALYIVAFDPAAENDGTLGGADAMKLRPGLYLVRTAASQSRLYHSVKRQARPNSLFVGRLDGDPKFKGMAEGALRWLRQE